MTNHFQRPILVAFLIVLAIGLTNIENSALRVAFSAAMCLFVIAWMLLTPWLAKVSREQQLRWHRERVERRKRLIR